MSDFVRELDPDVRKLLDLAATELDVPGDAKQRVAERLGVSLIAPNVPMGRGGGSGISAIARRPSALARGVSWISGPVVGAFVAGAATGATAYALLHRPATRVVYVDCPVSVPSASNGETSSSIDSKAPLEAPSADISKPARAEESVAPSAPAQRGSNLDAERALLDVARRELAEGHAADALRPLAAYSRRFPNGILAEEREALAVNALVGSGRYDEARERAGAFVRRYPNSLLRQSVDAAVAAIP